MKVSLSSASVLAIILAVAVFTAKPAQAAYTLTHGATSVQVDVDGQPGVYDWILGGQNHLTSQWFWYRVGSSGPETPLNSSSLNMAVSIATADQLQVTYTEPTGVFDITLNLTLTGAAPAADIEELITITNTQEVGDLEISFFQYVDFQLGGTPNNDTATITTVSGLPVVASAGQEDGTVMSETVLFPSPSYYEANDAATLLGKLTDGDADNLAVQLTPTSPNSTFGPGDAAWALQWDLLIPAGQSVEIYKDKYLEVPEPASLALVGLGAMLMIGGRRRA